MFSDTITDGLTFDDVLLVPRYSEVLPAEVNLETRLTSTISLRVPFMSAAMDTVTEAETAIAMARQGGLGVIHRNLSVEHQAGEVRKVKKSESGVILQPFTVAPSMPLGEAVGLMRQRNISGVPVVDNGELVGILTNRDIRFERNLEQPVAALMTRKLVTAPENISTEDAKELMHRHRIEKLPVVDAVGHLAGLITIKDIEKQTTYPRSTKDSRGRLMCAAAIGTGADTDHRVQALVEAGADVITVDSAHGHSKKVLDRVRWVRQQFPDQQIVAGNVATAEGTIALIDAGANAIKVGIGPGSICTTRVVAGVGVPQLTAIMDCAKAAGPRNVPIVADGGIKYSGDVVKAIAAGAHVVMMGSALGGTAEAPGEVVLYKGRSYKVYRGMGSIGAMKAGSSDRYGQEGTRSAKLVPEGIEGRVPFRGPVSGVLHQFVGGLMSGMGYCGCGTIEEMRTENRFIRITGAGLRESHVHDVYVTKEAPNYKADSYSSESE